MHKAKNQKFRKQLRKHHLEIIKKQCRERTILMQNLIHHLNQFHKCALVNGESDELQHRSFFDCQEFVVQTNKEIYRLTVAIGVENCKNLLLEHHIGQCLFEITEIIQNKTLQFGEVKEKMHYRSRERVLQSIADELCIFTENIQLIEQYQKNYCINQQFQNQLTMDDLKNQKNRCRQIAINQLINQFKKDYPKLDNVRQTWINPTIGLSNLFSYLQYEELVYEQLKGQNFQVIFQSFFNMCNVKQLIFLGDQLQINLIILFRRYLQYQVKYTDATLTRSLIKVMGQFTIKAIRNCQSIEYQNLQEKYQFIDDLLKMCIILPLNIEHSEIIFKQKSIYGRVAFVQLLSSQTYNISSLGLSKLNREEICNLLTIMNQQNQINYNIYSLNLVTSLLNMLVNDDASEKQIQRLWQCLQITNTVHRIFEDQRHYSGHFKQLINLLSTVTQEDL